MATTRITNEKLNFREPIITRGGNRIRLYFVGTDYIHGAYEADADKDVWHVCAWNLNGSFGDGHHMTSLDLINEETYEPQTGT